MKKLICPKCNKEELLNHIFPNDGEASYFENEINCPSCGIYEFNTCDKCQAILPTEELLWLADCSNFEAMDLIMKKDKTNYDALCEPCYNSIII